ncbi:MAG: hypothetical protein M0R03_19520, partial [Novosphingobium sp.]|nr:hypothetical protein [Novosphingobium sp.]
MKNKLPILAILLISLFKPNLTYSMEKSDEQQKNQSSLISEFTNALNNAFQEITCKDSEYIDYEQIALTIIDIFINGNQDQKTFLEAMNKTIAIDKFKDKFKEIGNTAAILLINKIIKNIPLNIISKIELLDDLSLDNYSQESKEEIFEQKRELIRNILITALDLTLSQEVKPQNKKNILKSIINYKLHQQTITVPEDLKDMMLGFSAIFTLWILGHIFCHDL